jgi:hypothetical protein
VIAPLDGAEERRAVEAAVAHVAPRRPVVYGAELRIEKRQRAIPDGQISVLLADLDGYTSQEVIVADDGFVVDTVDYAELVPPCTAEEIEEATVLARNHPDPPNSPAAGD